MELAAFFTLWACVSAWLLLPILGGPALLSRTALTLLCLELLALLIWSYGSESCVARPCGPAAETARTAAALDVPALTGLLIVLSAAYGVRATRAGR